MSRPIIQTNRRILIADDLEAIHQDFRKILSARQEGISEFEQLETSIFGSSSLACEPRQFEIGSAYQGEETLACVVNALAEERPYALAFIDGRMPPGWDGIETIDKIWHIDPDLQIVLCTAYSDYSWDDMPPHFRSSDRLVILKKPFDPIEVLQMAMALTEKWRLAQCAKRWVEELENIVATRTAELRTEIVERKRAEAELRRSQTELLKQERLAAIGQISAGVAHEFNNILTIIQAHAGVLLLTADELPPHVKNSLEAINIGTTRAATIIRQLLAFTRQAPIPHTPIHLGDVVLQMEPKLKSILRKNISLSIHSAPDLPLIEADSSRLEQIVLNLATNACEAMPDGGQLAIEVNVITIAPQEAASQPDAIAGDCVCLSVRDFGRGIAPKNLSRIFEPFFSTKDIGKGTGLGLAMVYGIVKQHRGWIKVESELGQGSIFRIFFPVPELPCRDASTKAETPAE